MLCAVIRATDFTGAMSCKRGNWNAQRQPTVINHRRTQPVKALSGADTAVNYSQPRTICNCLKYHPAGIHVFNTYASFTPPKEHCKIHPLARRMRPHRPLNKMFLADVNIRQNPGAMKKNSYHIPSIWSQHSSSRTQLWSRVNRK